MDPILILLTLLLALCLLVFLLSSKKDKHTMFQAKAEAILKEIQSKERPDGQVIEYLRTINPYVFEELVLSAFKRKGYKIRRNRRYSGDGGIDGRMSHNGVSYIIQCKRYKGHIHQPDVETFAKICCKKKAKGFFVHTGKTGEASRQTARRSDEIEIISGNRLVHLLKG